MRSFISLALVLPALLMLACGDDPVAPGELTVRWSHGPTATCESRNVVQVEARTYLKDVLENSATVSCPSGSSTGEIVLSDLTPGNHRVVVEAFDATGKGLYQGSADRQAVREGGSTQTNVITLGQKPVRLNITWTTPSGMCAGSPIRDVHVQYVPFAMSVGEVVHEDTVPCGNELADPDDPTELLAGVLFTDLVPNDDVVVFAWGLNAQGERIAQGKAEQIDLVPGDDAQRNIPLTLCPGTPPDCGTN